MIELDLKLVGEVREKLPLSKTAARMFMPSTACKYEQLRPMNQAVSRA